MHKNSMQRKRSAIGWLFLSPYILIVAAFLFTPLAYAGWMAIHTHKLVGGTQLRPLANFQHAFGDQVFVSGLIRVLLFSAVQVPIMLAIALFGALVLDLFNTKLSKVFRIVAFLPYAVPAVFGGVIWGFLFSTVHGPLPRLLVHFGFHNVNLFATSSFIYLVGNVVTWGCTGFNMIIIYSALQALPKDSYESAVLDGANQRQIARFIKIPEITGALGLTTIFAVIASTQLYSEPSILSRFTNGINNGYTPNMYAFSVAFGNAQFNYSAALSITLAIIVFIFSFGFIGIASRRRRNNK
jgi:multiple sugar transport system permease protein